METAGPNRFFWTGNGGDESRKVARGSTTDIYKNLQSYNSEAFPRDLTHFPCDTECSVSFQTCPEQAAKTILDAGVKEKT